MKILFAGTPDAAVPSLRALAAHRDIEVAAVITQPPARRGRGRKTTESPIHALANELQIPVHTPVSLRHDDAAAELADLIAAQSIDAVAVVAYGQIIPPALLSAPTHGWVNLHFSLLPAWRGAAPVQAAIAAGDEITGATTFILDRGLDTGPVLGTMSEEIRPDDTGDTLLARLAEAGAPLLVQSLLALASGQAHPHAQSEDGVSYAPRIDTSDALLDFTRPALALSRQSRALASKPGTWCFFRGSRIKVGPMQLLAEPDIRQLPPDAHSILETPGAIWAEKNRVVVATGSTPLVLSTVAPAGKGHMRAADWARGARPAPGEYFTTSDLPSNDPSEKGPAHV